MKKILCLTLAVWMLLGLAACKETESPQNSNSGGASSETEEKTAATPAEIEASLAEALGDGYLATMEVPEDELFTCALAEADLEKLDAYVAKQAVVSAVNLDSVVIAQCKEEAYADELVRLFNEKYDQISGYAAQYPFNLPKVQAARIYKVGDTVMYILAGANAEEGAGDEAAAQLAAAEYEKIDNAIKEIYGFVPENLASLTK